MSPCCKLEKGLPPSGYFTSTSQKNDHTMLILLGQDISLPSTRKNDIINIAISDFYDVTSIP